MTGVTTASSRPGCRVLVVDDEKDQCDLLSKMLKELGHWPEYALKAEDALAFLSLRHFDLVIVDWKLNHALATGDFALLKEITRRWPHIAVLMMSGWPEAHGGIGIEATRLGAADFLKKPFSLDVLAEKVHRALNAAEQPLQARVMRELRHARGLMPEHVPIAVETMLNHIETRYGTHIVEADISRPVLKAAGIAKGDPAAHRRALRQFEHVVGVSAAHYLAELRLRIADALLRETLMPVHTTALDCGYESPSSFTRAYHQRYGMTPTEARRVAQASRLPEAQEPSGDEGTAE